MPSEIKPNYVMKAKVIRVLDGDTLVLDISPAFHVWLNDRKVRLYGVDTPELNSTDPELKKRAQKARLFTTAAVMGKQVLMQSIRMVGSGDEKVDSFGRYLAIIFYKDDKGVQKNLNTQLVELGLASIWKE